MSSQRRWRAPIRCGQRPRIAAYLRGRLDGEPSVSQLYYQLAASGFSLVIKPASHPCSTACLARARVLVPKPIRAASIQRRRD